MLIFLRVIGESKLKDTSDYFLQNVLFSVGAQDWAQPPSVCDSKETYFRDAH